MKNNRTFIGHWKNDKREGQGKLIKDNGDYEVGYWENDK